MKSPLGMFELAVIGVDIGLRFVVVWELPFIVVIGEELLSAWAVCGV